MNAPDVVEMWESSARIEWCPLQFNVVIGKIDGLGVSEWAKIRWLHYIYMKENGKKNRVKCECRD